MPCLRQSPKSILIVLLTVLAALSLSNCSSRKSTQPDVITAKLGEQFELGAGQFATVEGTDFTVSLDKVIYDLRCPQGGVCDWPGIAELLVVIGTDAGKDTVALFIEGNNDPSRIQYLSTDTLGYNFQLAKLLPFAQAATSEKKNTESLRATLRIVQSELRDSLDGVAEVADISPGDISQDQFDLISVSITDNILRAIVEYPGGCERHFFYAYMTPSHFSDNNPREAEVYFRHFAGFDHCEALVRDTLNFSLETLRLWYISQYGQINPIKLKVHPFSGGAALETTYLPDATPKNHPPILNAVPPQTATAGYSLNIDLHAFDEDGDAITFALVNPPPHVAISSRGNGNATITFTPEAEDSGKVSLGVSVSDDSTTVFNEITVTVWPLRLSVSGQDSLSMRAGSIRTVEYRISSNGPEDIEGHLATPFGFATLSKTSDSLMTLILNQPPEAGTKTLELVIQGGYRRVSKAVYLEVTPNAKPQLAVVDTARVFQGTLDTIIAVATDPDGDALTLGVDNVSTAYQQSARTILKPDTLLFIFEPSQAISSWELHFFTSDGAWTTIDTTRIIEDFAEDLPPQFSSASPETVYVGAKLVWTIFVHDDHPQYLEFEPLNLPTGMQFSQPSDSSILLELTPTEEMLGTYPVSVQVSDGRNIVTFDSDLSVVEFDENMMHFAALPQQDLKEDEVAVARVQVLNAPSDVTMSMAGSPSYAELEDYGNGTADLIFAAPANSAGFYSIKLKALGGNIEVTDSVAFVVADIDFKPPDIWPDGAFGAAVNSEARFRITVIDGERELEMPQVSVSNLPPGASYSITEERFFKLYEVWVNVTYTPNPSDLGVHTFTVTATDSGATELTSEKSYDIIVRDFQQGTGELFPGGIGTTWVFDEGTNSGGCHYTLGCTAYYSYGTYSVSVVGSDTADGITWWKLSSNLPAFGSSYGVRNDTLFVRDNSTVRPKFWKTADVWYGYDTDFNVMPLTEEPILTPYQPYTNSQHYHDFHRFNNSFEYAGNDYWFVPGIGPVYFSVSTGSDDVIESYGISHTYRLIDFQPAPD